MGHWIKGEKSLHDKIRELLIVPGRLVLVQQHELERLARDAHRQKHAGYINSLYRHYIINGGDKTYLTPRTS